jgi:uncharacterized protein (TIGR03083 family)
MEIPIATLPLFAPLDDQLIRLLKTLGPGDWQKPTRAGSWTVKDVVSHLLDGNLRTISSVRDKFTGDPPGAITSYKELVDYLNQLNANWVRATQRISPPLLIEWLEITGKEYYACLKSLDPFAPAAFPVDWAGEKESKNWFHIAREYTEKWHHQQQIREALNKPGIMTREFYYPMMDTFMRALPHTYRNREAPNNSLIKITVTGEQGGQWFLFKTNHQWKLTSEIQEQPSAEVAIDPVTAWQLFTKGIDREAALKRMELRGDVELGKPILDMVSVMALRK